MPSAEFNGRDDQQEFREVEIAGDAFQEYADKNFILQTMAEIISAAPIASMNLIEGLSLAKHLGHGERTGLSIPKYALLGMAVSYARCFSSGIVTIKPEDYFSSDELKEHRLIIDFRSKYAAHDVSNLRANHLSVRVSESNEEFLCSPSVSDVVHQPNLAIQIEKLANIVKSKLEERIADLDKEVEAEIMQKSIEELRALPSRHSTRPDLKNLKTRRGRSHQ
ncbi:hypothetical protein [Phaeobacter italicus]|uniref:hypothetical protein n=1 Tax=Phaeobacter italicus TaxID=481446 RepID=UPI001C96035D|nr:hypothetical protein [Phaeobacter italicus]MBY6044401.1 hypothetical protein [Phaeobacter italicus]